MPPKKHAAEKKEQSVLLEPELGTPAQSNSHIDSKDEKWYRIANLALTILAFATRFYVIYYPNEVVFDEVHFGKFASYYLERTYFFDLHPPFAKLLIAAVGYIIGFDGSFKFKDIGDSYIANSVPYIPLRALSATLGSLTVPIMFNTMKECGYSIPTCVFAASLVLFDNAHVAETRLILLDATLIISVAASVYCYVKFTKQRESPFTLDWWKWLLATGVALSCVISTKYVGVFTFVCVGVAVAWDLWGLLDYKKGLSIKKFCQHFYARFICLILIPFYIYLMWFYIHFAVLTKSGPGDAFMTPEFQETLGDSPLARESKVIYYHDIVTIKHKDTSCLLHSHPFNYPLRYDDGRVSTQGQQVTCATLPQLDANDYWEILPNHHFKEGDVLNKNVVVGQGDIIRLRHVGTNGYLLTHDVASPMYPTNEEFTVINVEEANGPRYNDTLFRLDPADKKPKGQLKTKSSEVKIFHVPTVVTMWTHNDEMLPEWGFGQQEVNGNKKVQDNDNYWTFDSIIGLSAERAKFIPKPIKKLPFLRKWWELQLTMFEQNNKLSSEHPFASDPISWPVCLSGVSFWTKNEAREQIYFIGNIFGWWIECGLLATYLVLILIDQLTMRRNIQVFTDKGRSRLYLNIGFFFAGWATHYFPFFLMSRQKFLHHYLPAHLLAALFAGAMLEFCFTDNLNPDFTLTGAAPKKSGSKKEDPNATTGKLQMLPYLSTLVVLFSILITVFIFYAPLTYGNTSLSIEEILKREFMNIKLHFSK